MIQSMQSQAPICSAVEKLDRLGVKLREMCWYEPPSQPQRA